MQTKIFVNDDGLIDEMGEGLEDCEGFEESAELEDVELAIPVTFDADLSDLIKKAKNGAPEFLLEFEDAFPNFITALKEIDPNIRGSELLFCAMSYLNLTTKEISNSTYVTVRAVQIRKNRLRKKLNIGSDVDFNFWMRNLKREE